MTYSLELPEPSKLRTLWMDVLDQDRPRLRVTRELRQVINGKNVIPLPPAVAYKAEAQHAYLYRNAVNAMASRYRHFPEFMVAPEYNKRGNIDSAAEKRASRIEKFHSRLGEMWERESSVWTRIVEDAVSYFVAGERIECAPASDWKEVILLDEMADSGKYPFEEKEWSAAREKAKRSAGVPIRSVHVPSDALHWIREGNSTTEVFEVEQRNLRAVVSNPLFADSDFVKDMRAKETKLKEKVTVLHFSNHIYHAYYALAPSENWSTRDEWPTGDELSEGATGQPMLLYAYEHGIGRPIYNIVWGPYGPWEGNIDQILGRLQSLRDLSVDADKYKTWIATAARRLGFPTYQMTYDPDNRVDIADQRPKEVDIPEGGVFGMWRNEELRLIPNQFDLSAVKYAYEDTVQRFHEIAGVASQYGVHQEGAATGYHEAFLLQQSRSKEFKQEIGLKHGAEGRADIVNRYIRYRLKEDVSIVHSELKGGQAGFEYITIGPDDLDPMPTFEASVIAPTPQDFDKALANAQRALAPDGSGRPLLDRSTVLTQILQVPNPDEVERRINIDMQKAAAMASPAYQNYIVQLMMTSLAQKQAEQASVQQFANADPALLAAGDMAMQSGDVSMQGGMSPQTAMGMESAGMPNAAGMQGMGGGMPTGMEQPMQVAGLTDIAMEGMA